MNKTIRNIAKGLAYMALYMATQVAASYMLIVPAMVYFMMKDPTILETAEGIDALLERIIEFANANTSILLLIAGAMLLLILFIFFRARGKRLTRETWMQPVRPASLWPIIPLGISLALVICYGITWIPWPENILTAYDELYAMTNNETILTFFVTVLLAPVIEEIVFRGLVFTRFCRAMPAIPAMLLGSILFGVMHGTLLWAAYGAVGGIAMTLVYMKYRSLYASMLLHAVFNLVGGYLVTFLVFPNAAYDFGVFGLALATLAFFTRYLYQMPRRRIDIIQEDTHA